MDDDGREELGDTTCDYGGWWKGWAKRVWMQTFHSLVPFLQISTCFVFGLLVTFDKKKNFFNNLVECDNIFIFDGLETSCIIIFSKEEEREENK